MLLNTDFPTTSLQLQHGWKHSRLPYITQCNRKTGRALSYSESEFGALILPRALAICGQCSDTCQSLFVYFLL